MAIVYCATNKITNKKYIGLTKQTLDNRKKGHRCNVKKGKKSAFYDAWRKYGEDNFEWKILFQHNNLTKVVLQEEYFIKYYNTIVPAGYNILCGRMHPPNMKNIPKSDDHKKKISEANKGRTVPIEVRKKISKSLLGNIPWNKGKTKCQIAWNKGIPHTQETKNKISIKAKGRIAWNKGIPRTQEDRKKIREGRLKSLSHKMLKFN